MDKPTEAQIKEFWEWCGIKAKWAYHDFFQLVDSNGAELAFGLPPFRIEDYPSIDLNNLFKYAVPVAIKIIMTDQKCGEYRAYKILFKEWLQIGYDALALFWALWQVKGD